MSHLQQQPEIAINVEKAYQNHLDLKDSRTNLQDCLDKNVSKVTLFILSLLIEETLKV